MKKLVLLLALIALIPVAFSINYPVKELGNCESRTACEKYCDIAENAQSCLAFAEKNGLMSNEELNSAMKMLIFIKNGEAPGKCQTEKSCNEYCDNEKNIDECVDFALKIGEISKEEAQMAKKSKGKGPGGCKREECRTYCNDESHFSECVDFAAANGIIDAKEAELVKKTGGKGPGNCKGKFECDSYCQNPAHSEECLDFSVQYGMIDTKEAEMIKACMKGPESCNFYCYSSDERFKQCIVMWEDNSNNNRPSKEDLARMKIQYYDSPGNCKGNQECLQKYCSQEKEAILFECERFSVKMGQRTEAEFEKWKQEFEQKKQESERKDLEQKGMQESQQEQGCPDVSKPGDECFKNGGNPQFDTDAQSGCLRIVQCASRQEMQCSEGAHEENGTCVPNSQPTEQPQGNDNSGNQEQPPSNDNSGSNNTSVQPAPEQIENSSPPQAQTAGSSPSAEPITGQVIAAGKGFFDKLINWFLGK